MMMAGWREREEKMDREKRMEREERILQIMNGIEFLNKTSLV